jgi:hypothetical protein
MKQATLQWLEDPNQINGENLDNARHEMKLVVISEYKREEKQN